MSTIHIAVSHIINRCYAKAVHDHDIDFDVAFGPAYKGIPLVIAFSIAYYEMYGIAVDFAYNRKEAKDHGEVKPT
jgi:orotate phosphoribosyltransferase